ncbi:DNA-binding SCF ubiquitin ligase subunit dia2 [Lodderomyces elongisporus]|uniref:DNA-binding SCF ubiquitin ligase subunit dia2 n=1 Tax=Lodderomyces elongisporus TaxID=36914 RepID=UPI0029209FBA|nr:DNA-binding SCF ubiquitin ligase subunit dia2 [Lodderomyces elongisporus]WLF78574.1 DNA-binding SCF ubiquitin ligase subunit dia2 [Lodderomyces elongisporus]
MTNGDHRTAVTCFKTGDYIKALSIFNQLIYKSKQAHFSDLPPLSTLLDQRAAVYEKLGQHDLALRDARSIIEKEPANCKGYLRAGKLLTLQNKKFEAYKLYQEGLYVIDKLSKEARVEVNEKLFASLKQQYRFLNSELKQQSKKSNVLKSSSSRTLSQSSSNSRTLSQSSSSFTSASTLLSRSTSSLSSRSTSRSSSVISKRSQDSPSPANVKRLRICLDPIRILPSEVVAQIFTHVSDAQLLRCLLVSKSWYKALTSFPWLFTFNCKMLITLEEFRLGVRFMKQSASHSTSKQIKHVKINHVAKQKLAHVLSTLVTEPHFPIYSLDIADSSLNLQLLYAILSKHSWRLNNFQQLKKVRLGINCSMKYPHVLLKLFAKLEELEITILKPENSSMNLVPITDKRFKILKETPVQTQYTLKKLCLINHSKLLRNEGVAITAQTYSPFPVLLDHSFPNLEELTLVSFQFANHLPQFGYFVSQLNCLKSMYLENNDGLDLLTLLQMFLNYKPSFKLKHFTFRESRISSSISLQQISETYLTQFKHLETLDLYGNCLSTKGLYKLLKVCGKTLASLNLGNANYYSFEMHSQRKLELGKITQYCPLLTTLCLSDMNIDAMAMLHLTKSISQSNLCLRNLDLSFNAFDGMDLLRFLGVLEKRLLEPLETLVVHGMSIQKDTLEYVKRKLFAKHCLCDPQRLRWSMYGVNSWVQ